MLTDREKVTVPKLVKRDEPTTGLDAVSRAELAAYVKRNKQSQLIIIVSHDDEMVGAVEGVVDLGSMYRGKC